MKREEARRVVGNQPHYALRNMALALQIAPWRNDSNDWHRLRALKSLGYRVTVSIPD